MTPINAQVTKVANALVNEIPCNREISGFVHIIKIIGTATNI